MAATSWKPIEDLPENWLTLVSTELGSLAEIWKTQAIKLHTSEALKQFNDRLAREWAIETGIIENLYSIDRGTTQLLIEKGIQASLMAYGSTDRPAEKIVPILQAQQEALEGLFAFVKQERDLSTFYVRELHQAITRHQDIAIAQDQFGNLMEVELLRGDWKKLPNNPTRPDGVVHLYSPPEQVASEMDRLIELYKEHIAKNVPPEVEAAWLHHRFAQIHPFQDGNGRVARALATLVFLRAGWFPLVVTRDDRSAYLDALEKSDDGDLSPLVQLFVEIEKKAFIRALSLSEEVIKEQKSLREVIAAIGQNLKAKDNLSPSHLVDIHRKAAELSEVLENIAYKELLDVTEALNKEFDQLNQDYKVKVLPTFPYIEPMLLIKRRTISIAEKLGYYANTNVYSKHIGIELEKAKETQSQLLLSFHGLGIEFIGILAVSAYILYWEFTGRSTEQPGDGLPLSKEVFQFTYNENKLEVVERFQKWLNDALVEGLNRWNKELF